MSETFPFDVAFETTFEQVEALRDKMLVFVKQQRRDFLPSFDVVVVGMICPHTSTQSGEESDEGYRYTRSREDESDCGDQVQE
jgi:hypothetical protein